MMVQGIMVLSVPKISQYILCIIRGGNLVIIIYHQFAQVQIVNEFLVDLTHVNAGSMNLFLLILSVLRLEGILRTGQHGSRDRQNVLYRVPTHQS